MAATGPTPSAHALQEFVRSQRERRRATKRAGTLGSDAVSGLPGEPRPARAGPDPRRSVRARLPAWLVCTSVARRSASRSQPTPGQRGVVCRPRAPVVIPACGGRSSPWPTSPMSTGVRRGEWSAAGTGRAGLPRSGAPSQASFHVEQDVPTGRSATRCPGGPGRREAPGACGAARGSVRDAGRPPAAGRVTGEPAPNERCCSRR
jgi:hypothetical protein